MGSTLERHPFSGLIHSAGELLHRGGRRDEAAPHATFDEGGLDYIKDSRESPVRFSL